MFPIRKAKNLSRQQLSALLVLLGYSGRKMMRKDALEWLAGFLSNPDPAINDLAQQAYDNVTLSHPLPMAGGSSSPINAEAIAESISALVTPKVDEKLNAAIESIKQKADIVLCKAAAEMQQRRRIEIVAAGKATPIKEKTHHVFEKVLQLASQRVNVMLVGPAGCGKTHLGDQIAKALNLPFSSISCSAGMSESQLAGWLLPVGDGGKFDYVSSPFVNCYEKGGVFLLDEIDSGDSNTLTFINKALANSKFFVPQRLKKPEVAKHQNFVAMAAANTFGIGADAMYVGRNQLDAATLDRFRAGMVFMDYDIGLETCLINPSVLEWGLRIREIIKDRRLRRIMSTRTMIELSKMTEAYSWKMPEWESAYFSDWSADERGYVS